MRKLLIGVALLLTCTTLYGQTFKIDKVFEKQQRFAMTPVDTNGIRTLPDTLYYQTDIVPVASDSVALIWESTIDSISVRVTFSPSSPTKVIDPKQTQDTAIALTSARNVIFGTATALPASKQYGRYYIRVVNIKKLPSSTLHTFKLWMIRRFK